MEKIEVLWNKKAVGFILNPNVDNFFYYGKWVPTTDKEIYKAFLDAIEPEGADVICSNGQKGNVAAVPNDEIDIRLRN